MFIEKIFRLIGGLFVGAYVARYLGPSQYGLLNYSISLISLFSVMASLGLETIVIRELVKDESKMESILGTAIRLRLLGAVVVSLILMCFIYFTHKDPLTQQILYIITATIFFEVFGVFDYFFQSKVLSKFVVWSQLIALISVSVFRVALVIHQAPITSFAWSYVIDAFFVAAGLIYFAHSKMKLLPSYKQWNLVTAKHLLRDSWALIFASFAITIYMKVDQIMIKWLINDAANGVYGVAVRLSEMWNFVPVAICASFFPAILNAKQTSANLYHDRLQKLYDLIVSLSIIVAIAMTFCSEFIIEILFGQSYAEAADILSLYVWSGVFVFLGVANGKWIIAENLQVFRMKSLIVAGVLNVILNFYFIEKIGLKGAALSTIISYAFASYFSLLFSKRTRLAFVASSKAFNLFRILKYFVKTPY